MFGVVEVRADDCGLKHTNSSARTQAEANGFTETKQYPKNLNPHGSLVFKNKNTYISPDNTAHNYDYAWKAFDTTGNRIGTAVFENGELVIKKN